MSELRSCPQCHAEIPVNSPAGLCPRCLLNASVDSQSNRWEGATPAEPERTKRTPPASGFVPPSVDELAGLFPQLEILELLGKGGMGAVYKARQPGLDRLVAVKILPPEISRDPTFAERFQREARALARLSHPHIVAVYDFGTTSAPLAPPGRGARGEGSLCYIVMEFVDGANLRQAIRTGRLTSAEALAIVPQICEALQFAHDEGIVHRDIKPENILIDKRGRVKIADFGLAKLLGTDASDHSLTATHQVMGTLRYMAPEQMQGSREVDHRADIFSLGVVFYELLTGELPMGKFAPPSKRVQVDVRLDEIVLRALEADPEQRYQHASEVKTDVETISRESESPNPNAQKPGHRDGSMAAAEPISLPFTIAGSVHWGLFGEVHGKLRRENNAVVVEFEVRSLFPAFRTGLKEVSIPFDAIESVNWDGWDLTLHTKSMKALAEIPGSSQGQVAFDLSMTDLDVPGGISKSVEYFLACLPSRLAGKSVSVARPLTEKDVGTEQHIDQAPDDGQLPAAAKQQGFRGVSKPPQQTLSDVREPRFSWFAIAGAVWALFGLLAIVPSMYFIGLNRVWNGTALPTDVIYSEPPVAFTIFMCALLAIGAGAPIGTTILGGVAIGHIKRTDGKVVGLSLAVADVLGFPLLIINGAIFGVLLYFNHWGVELNFAMSLSLAVGETAFIGGGVSSVIVKRVWGVVSPPEGKSGERQGVSPPSELEDAGLGRLTPSRSPSGSPPKQPKLVPVLATFNLFGAVVLMLVSAMEQPTAIAESVPRLWQVWETVDCVLGFVTSAGLFAASIGLFLWKPWARKLTLGVCVFALAHFVFDIPYLARFVLPDFYAEMQLMLAVEAVDPDVLDLWAMGIVIGVAVVPMLVALSCLIGQLVYFTRPRVVTAFESLNELPSKFVDWLFTGTGAVVGVLSVFGPLALLLGSTAMFHGSSGDQTPGTITNGIGAEFTVPAGQVAVFEVVTRRDGATVAVPPHCGYLMAPSDTPVTGTFLWTQKPEEGVVVGSRRICSLEILADGKRAGSTEGTVLPEELNDAVGSMSLGLGVLERNAESVHWQTVDANNLPVNGLIGLRVTVVTHGLNTRGSGIGHIDWRTPPPSPTTRRTLPDGTP